MSAGIYPNHLNAIGRLQRGINPPDLKGTRGKAVSTGPDCRISPCFFVSTIALRPVPGTSNA
jgi:hypothetical protein